ncbi:MAG: hypothetical protein HW408_1341 [Actinobacteria bacterium]|nr:hypothetical protein [Actinomycetota bacterium]
MTPGRKIAALAFIAALVLVSAGPAVYPARAAEDPASSCVSCHAKLGGKLGPPAREFPLSVHREAGLTCVTCHGGNPALPGEESMSPKHGFRGKPSRKQIPEFCARCHSSIAMMRQYNLRTDQFAEYRTSIHGKLLFERNDPGVAVCTSCHGMHEIRRKSDPKSHVSHSNVPATCGRCHADAAMMKPYRIPTSQMEDFEKGVHGRILAGKIQGKNPNIAPNCATCHGIHGATPPGVREVANVCGACHSAVVGYFRESAHFTAIREGGGPKCVTCHGNHSNRKPTLQVFSGTEQGECGSCHKPDSAALDFARNAQSLLGNLDNTINEIQKDLVYAERSGRNIEKLKQELDNARYKVTEAGPVIHAFAIERILPIVQEADAHIRKARQEIQDFQAELQQRRKVAAYAVSMLLLIAALLWVKLKLLPKASPPGEDNQGLNSGTDGG